MSLPKPIKDSVHVVVHTAPFFAHLILSLHWQMASTIQTACTNGYKVWINPHFFSNLNAMEQAGLIAHEAMHCALRHMKRAHKWVKTKAEMRRWNVAADIVVNEAIIRAGLELPKGAIRDPKWAHLSTEEIFHKLKKTSRAGKMGGVIGAKHRDLITEETEAIDESEDFAKEHIDWDMVLRRADLLARRQGGTHFGMESLGISREVKTALGIQRADWRELLWQHLTPMPNDWQGWDRRSIYKGEYHPCLKGKLLEAVVGIDTSGSIHSELLAEFLEELSHIAQVVPQVDIQLFWTDTKVYGPVSIGGTCDVAELSPKGGGGTDLRPLFSKASSICTQRLRSKIPLIYLTDGLGPMPEKEPEHLETLWVVPFDSPAQFSFGTEISLGSA